MVCFFAQQGAEGQTCKLVKPMELSIFAMIDGEKSIVYMFKKDHVSWPNLEVSQTCVEGALPRLRYSSDVNTLWQCSLVFHKEE